MKGYTKAAREDRIARQVARGQRLWDNMTKEERKDLPIPKHHQKPTNVKPGAGK